MWVEAIKAGQWNCLFSVVSCKWAMMKMQQLASLISLAVVDSSQSAKIRRTKTIRLIQTCQFYCAPVLLAFGQCYNVNVGVNEFIVQFKMHRVFTIQVDAFIQRICWLPWMQLHHRNRDSQHDVCEAIFVRALCNAIHVVINASSSMQRNLQQQLDLHE